MNPISSINIHFWEIDSNVTHFWSCTDPQRHFHPHMSYTTLKPVKCATECREFLPDSGSKKQVFGRKTQKNEQKRVKNLFCVNFGYFLKSKLRMDVIFGISVLDLCSWCGNSVDKHRNKRKKAICNYRVRENEEWQFTRLLPVCVISAVSSRVFSWVLFTPFRVWAVSSSSATLERPVIGRSKPRFRSSLQKSNNLILPNWGDIEG